MTSTRRALLIVLVSLLAHAKGITSPPLDYHYHRQTATAMVARNFHRDGLPFLQPRGDIAGNDRSRMSVELPLYSWSVGLLWPVFKLGDLWGRLLSVLCSALTALMLFRLLSDRRSRGAWMETRPAFFAALSFSVLPVEVYFGRTIQPEAMALLCSIASLWALDRYLDASPQDPIASRSGWWLLSCACASAAMGLKIPYTYLLAVCAALAWVRRGKACLKDPRLLVFAPAALGPMLLWYWYESFATVHQLPTSLSGMSYLLNYTREPKILGYYVFFLAFSRFPELTTTYSGLLLLAIGIRRCVKGRSWFLLAWWGCVWLYTVAGGGYNFHHEYTALPFAPINAAFMGLGLDALWTAIPAISAADTRRWAWVGLTLLVLGMPVHAALRINHWYRPSFTFLSDAKQAVDRLSSQDDLFLCNQRAPSVYLYAIDRRGWSWDVSHESPEPWPRIEEAVRNGAKYFLTEKDDVFSNPGHPIPRYFQQHFTLAYGDDRMLIFHLSHHGGTPKESRIRNF